LCAVSFGLALAFAAFGAWLVLPYSALEMLVLYVAFRWIDRHATDWERVTVAGDRVTVERERGGVLARHEFNRFWTRVELQVDGFGRSPRLELRFAGKSIAVGEELSAPERARLARDLRRALARA